MPSKYDKIISKLEDMSISTRPRRCLQNHSSSCTLCFDSCPVKAISFAHSEEGRPAPEIDFRLCNRCGACATLCPTEVFEMAEITDEKILLYTQMLSDYASAIAFSCSYQLQRMGMVESVPTITLPCLARLNEAILVGPATLGVSTTWVNSAFCKECPNQKVSAIIEKTAQTSQGILDIYGSSARIIRAPEPPENIKKKRPFRKKLPPLEDFEPVSRRGFFEGIRKSVLSTGVLLVESELSPFLREPTSSSEVERHLPQKRLYLLRFLKKMGKPTRRKAAIGDFPFFPVRIKENCSGCESCLFFCPTGALTKTKSEGTAHIEFSIALCTGCDLCREFCPDKAVYYGKSFDPDLLQNGKGKALISFGSYACEQCKTEFISPTPSALCRYCQKKRAIFGS